MTQTTTTTLVVSMSEIALFNRCRKAWELGYVRNLEPIVTSDAVVAGSSFHQEMEAYAHERRGTLMPNPLFQSADHIFAVAQAYKQRKAANDFDNMAAILSIEEPVYTPILPALSMLPMLEQAGIFQPEVLLRTTHDLVYQRETGWRVIRDYKTFEREPSQNYDLDFQARLYIAAGMMHYNDPKVEFEFENVRRSVPGEKRGTTGNKVWLESECYITQPLVISQKEALETWKEAQHIVAQILLAREISKIDPSVFYRQSLKVGPHSCSSCFYRYLCSADYQGTMDADFIAEYARVRPPKEVPTTP